MIRYQYGVDSLSLLIGQCQPVRWLGAVAYTVRLWDRLLVGSCLVCEPRRVLRPLAAEGSCQKFRTRKSESLAQKSGTTLRNKYLADHPLFPLSIFARSRYPAPWFRERAKSIQSATSLFKVYSTLLESKGYGELIRLKMPSVVEQQLQGPKPMTTNSESIATQQPVGSPLLLLREISCKLVCS